jgi:hypothetical protein
MNALAEYNYVDGIIIHGVSALNAYVVVDIMD